MANKIVVKLDHFVIVMAKRVVVDSHNEGENLVWVVEFDYSFRCYMSQVCPRWEL